MESYWDRSWAAISPERIRTYAEHFNAQFDSLLHDLRAHGVTTVCDAGCGCGIYARLLAENGFAVSGFDVSSSAVAIAQTLLNDAGLCADLSCASVMSTGYAAARFDGVICRDVLDHMHKRDALRAIDELLRITKPDGLILITLDGLDDEYLQEPHSVTADGDFVFSSGKWEGMVFHPYTEIEIAQMLPVGSDFCIRQHEGGLLLSLQKT